MSKRRGTPRLVRARLREAEAMTLRASGLCYDTIARRLGYGSRASAYKAVRRAMEATRMHAALTLRVMMYLRFEGLLEELGRAVTARDMRRAMAVVEGPLAEAEWQAWQSASRGKSFPR